MCFGGKNLCLFSRNGTSGGKVGNLQLQHNTDQGPKSGFLSGISSVVVLPKTETHLRAEGEAGQGRRTEVEWDLVEEGKLLKCPGLPAMWPPPSLRLVCLIIKHRASSTFGLLGDNQQLSQILFPLPSRPNFKGNSLPGPEFFKLLSHHLK